MLEKSLQDVGLSEKEALTYLALLKVDNASVVELARGAKLKRPTVYLALAALAKKGLVSETTVGKRTHYQAEPPERLETFVERQRLVLDERAKRLRDLIPEIKSIERTGGERPVVKYFEGREGILHSYEESLAVRKEGETMYNIYSRDVGNSFFTPAERKMLKGKRLHGAIKSRSVYNFSKGDILDDAMSERVRLDEHIYPIYCDIEIYGDEVRINSLVWRRDG